VHDKMYILLYSTTFETFLIQLIFIEIHGNIISGAYVK
jgi:hypothetical protein